MTGNRVWQASCAHLLSRLPAGSEQRLVADLGIGPGVSAISMGAAHPQARFIGVDISRPMLKLARGNRERAGWSPGRLKLVQADAGRLPFAAAVLDAAVGHSFLYLLPDRRAALAEVGRILRPTGLAAFLEPNSGRPSWRWLLRQRSGRLLVSLSLWRFYNWLHGRFSPERFQAAFGRAGLEYVESEIALGGFGIYGRARKP